VRNGETIHIPANAPHQFHNSSSRPEDALHLFASGARGVLPTGGDSRSDPYCSASELDQAQQAALVKKSMDLAPKAMSSLAHWRRTLTSFSP
jgi:hypothetical protein